MKTVIVFLLFMIEFGFAQLPEYKITMSPADYELLYTRDIFSDSLLPAVFEYQGTFWNDARIRFKGRSTRFFPKKSYRVRFSTLNQFQNARQINFNSMYTDKSFIREKLAWDLFNDMNLMAPKAHHSEFIMNNEWKGVYLFVDKIDRYFLQRNGRIVSPMYEADDFWSLGDLTIQPDSLLKLYYPKEVGDATDYSDLRALIEAINLTPDSTFADVIANLFDMNSVYQWFAGNVLMMMGDSYNKNYFLYRDTSRLSQQWVIIPWDYDLSFGRSGDLAWPYPASLLNDGFAYTFSPLSGPDNVLKNRFWNTLSLREQLRLRVDTLLQTVYTEERMHARIDSLSALVDNDVARDPRKWGTYEDFLDHVDALKYFVTARRNYLLKTFVNPPSGQYNIVTLPITGLNIPYHFVAFDGRQLATLWFTDFQGLDSVLIQAYPDSSPPNVPNPDNRRYVRRWLQVMPFPSTATFTMKLQWMYVDHSSMEREVEQGVQDERQLRTHFFDGLTWNIVPSRINSFANIVTMDSITQEQCGSGKYFALFLPEYTQTWYRRPLTNWERWYDVKFSDGQNGFVIGDHGTVLRTQDSGSTWQQFQIGVNFPFRKLAVIDSANLFAAGDFGSLYNSTNAGITWSKIDLGTRKNLRSITFASSNVGWVVGEGGMLSYTSDGGLSWAEQFSDSGPSFNHVAAFSETNLLVVADSGIILTTINSGMTWQKHHIGITNSLYGIGTLYLNHVWLVGDRGIVMYSSNRGISWVDRSLPTQVTLRDIAVIDSTELYVVGNNGKIFYTIDNGLNWYGQYAETSYDLNAIDFIDRTHGFAVGNGGTILSTTTMGTLTDVKTSVASLPETFRLYQNYPNPFNPITTIAYEIPRPSYVAIKVYNTLGQEVDQIVNSYTQAGRHTATWNANNNSSGVYYIRIVAQEFGFGRTFSEVKKAVVIK